MQISTSSSQEVTARERMEPACPLRCPVCNGALVPLHNSFRCSHCAYHLCASCEAVEPEMLNPIV